MVSTERKYMPMGAAIMAAVKARSLKMTFLHTVVRTDFKLDNLSQTLRNNVL